MVFIIILLILLLYSYYFDTGSQSYNCTSEGYTLRPTTLIKWSPINNPIMNLPSQPVESDGFKIVGGPLLTVAQILLFDDKGIQLQYGNYKNIKASSQFKPYTTPDNALDGNIYYTKFPHVWHASGIDASAWMSANFDSPKKISKIVIYNRSDCCQNRMDGAIFSLLLGNDTMLSKNIMSTDFINNVLTVKLGD